MSIDTSAVPQWPSSLLQWSVLFLVIWMPLRDVLQKGRFRTSFFSMWIGLVGWSVLVSFLSPSLVILHSSEPLLFGRPDSKLLTSYVFLGFIPALLICGIGFLFRKGWLALSGPRASRGHHRAGAWSL